MCICIYIYVFHAFLTFRNTKNAKNASWKPAETPFEIMKIASAASNSACMASPIMDTLAWAAGPSL